MITVKFRDRTGQKIGKLTVIQRVLYPSKDVYWECECECGNRTIVRANKLNGRTTSCGCNQHNPQHHITHGMQKTQIYKVWAGMIARCKHKQSYIRKNIQVCEEWKTFTLFYRDMGDIPEGMTLERVDNSKGYMPSNVIWADRVIQANNRETNVFVEYQGKRQTIIQWSRELDIEPSTIRRRIISNLPTELVLYQGDLRGKTNT